jgi:Amt family ammonium transporter
MFALSVSCLAYAQEAAPTPEPGDTAWMLTSTVLVLFMTIPGLALFYGGLVRSKNVLSVLMQCFTITAMATLLWVICGYSLAFAVPATQVEGVIGLHAFVGDFSNAFLKNLTVGNLTLTFPESVFAERMKFSAVLIFTAFWLVLVYAPMCHMAWSGAGALFWDWGVLDFAGGTVVHINAGIAALVACIMVGKRAGYPQKPMPPHNMTMTVTGAGMLWVGWFGFNAGSAAAANGTAGMAMLVTQICAATATLTWLGIEWLKHGKPSALGAATGAVAGLVAITPASGTCGPLGAILMGIAAGGICFLGATAIKRAGGYDDSLDAFGVHGIGGVVGALLTGVFASDALGGVGYAEGKDMVSQVMAQAMSVGVTLAYSGIVSLILFKAIDLTIGLRVSEEVESQGLDLAEHGEEGYII